MEGEVKYFDTLFMKEYNLRFQDGEDGEKLKSKHPQSYVIANHSAILKKNDSLIYAQYVGFRHGKKVDYDNDLSIRQTTYPWRGNGEMTKKHFPRKVLFSDSIGNTLILLRPSSATITTSSPSNPQSYSSRPIGIS